MAANDAHQFGSCGCGGNIICLPSSCFGDSSVAACGWQKKEQQVYSPPSPAVLASTTPFYPTSLLGGISATVQMISKLLVKLVLSSFLVFWNLLGNFLELVRTSLETSFLKKN